MGGVGSRPEMVNEAEAPSGGVLLRLFPGGAKNGTSCENSTLFNCFSVVSTTAAGARLVFLRFLGEKS